MLQANQNQNNVIQENQFLLQENYEKITKRTGTIYLMSTSREWKSRNENNNVSTRNAIDKFAIKPHSV